MDKLADLFKDLNISRNEDSEIDYLIENIKSIKISGSDKGCSSDDLDKDIEEVVSNMKRMNINDKEVTLESDYGKKLIIVFESCHTAFLRKRKVHPFVEIERPDYVEAF